MTSIPQMDPQTSADNALSALSAAGAQASKLIALWAVHDNAAALLQVVRRGQGQTKKEAKKALRGLKARGISIPNSRVASLGAAGKTTEHAFMLPPDASLSTLFALASRSQTSRYRAAFVYVSAELGVQRIDVVTLSHSALRSALDDALRGGGSRVVDVPIEWARQRIAEALEAQKKRGGLEPMQLKSAKDLLEPAPSSPVSHPFDSEGFALSLEDAREMAKTSRELHALPEFRGWLPPKVAVDELLTAVGKSLKPGEQPEDSALKAALDAASSSATDRFFTPERRQLVAAAMKDSALSVFARAGEQEALQVAAAISCIENAGLITDPPSGVPFLVAFFEKALGVLLAQSKGQLRIPVAKNASSELATADAPAIDVADGDEAKSL